MITANKDSWRVVDLSLRPDLLDVVTQWHQQAWSQSNGTERREKLREHLQPESLPLTLLGFMGHELTGSVSLVRYKRFGGYPPSVWLANLYVRPESRRQGLGARLVTSAVDRAAELQLQQLYLYTHDHEQYYRKLGWLVVKRRCFAQRPITIMKLMLN